MASIPPDGFPIQRPREETGIDHYHCGRDSHPHEQGGEDVWKRGEAHPPENSRESGKDGGRGGP